MKSGDARMPPPSCWIHADQDYRGRASATCSRDATQLEVYPRILSKMTPQEQIHNMPADVMKMRPVEGGLETRHASRDPT
jgi:hypothetical protein